MVYPVAYKSKKRRRHKKYLGTNSNLPKFFQPYTYVQKEKCEKYLKKKFKKYKLNPNNIEDSEIIFISNKLKLQLQVRSPIKDTSFLKVEECKYFDGYERPKNYLFKMAKHKENLIKSNSKHNFNQEILSSEKKKMCEMDLKKQTNAFQLMMDSRNKSIGSNSPGKEIIKEVEPEEIMHKKNDRIKRKLVLQKMADAKGALERQAKENYQDKLIQKKLQKRADLLKDMLLKSDKKQTITKKCSEKKNTKKINAVKDGKKKSNIANSSFGINEVLDKSKNLSDVDQGPKKEIKELCDKSPSLLSKSALNNKELIKSPKLDTINKEDSEFLKKLSPSIKKKENMLSYFKKINKSDVSFTLVDDNEDNENLSEQKHIRVKFTPNKKNKLQRKNLNLIKNEDNIPLSQLKKKKFDQPDVFIKSAEEQECLNKEHKNRKRKINYGNRDQLQSHTLEVTVLSESKDSSSNENSRPRRNIKKIVKYDNELSSEEEFSKIISKKRKHVEKENIIDKDHKISSEKKNLRKEHLEEKALKKIEKKKSVTMKSKPKPDTKSEPEKLAPIFKTKTIVDTAALEAKQKFLQSGIPDKLKKIISQKKAEQSISEDVFLLTVHIQQNSCVKPTKEVYFLQTEQEVDQNDMFCNYNELSVNSFFKNRFNKECISKPLLLTPVDSVQNTLNAIKLGYPEFPVYRTYKNLKNKLIGNKHISVTELDSSNDSLNDIHVFQEDPKSLPWVEKYKALSSKEIIGNFDSLKELKRWLVVWRESNSNIKKQPSKDNSDYSDFYDSDTDSRDSVRMSDNLLIVTGPTGCGKTTGVHAVAAELSIKVIEVNVSSKRTGKIMLQDLHEATQSHKVNRGAGSKENSQNILDDTHPKKNVKKGRPSKTNSTSSKTEESNLNKNDGYTGMSLILIDDADIVFEQDDGFTSAVFQLVQFSKRPVIIVTSSLTCHHLQKFVQCKTIIKMKPLSPRMLGTWLDIMCLADSGVCRSGTGAFLLEYFNGDIRKSINHLQYIICSGKIDSSVFDTPNSEDSCDLVDNIQDETSNQSWIGQNTENTFDDIKSQNVNTCSIEFLDMDKTNKLDIFTMWWNIPKYISQKLTDTDCDKLKDRRHRENIYELCEIVSYADSILNGKINTNKISSNPWREYETDSVSEMETLIEYNRSTEFLQDEAKSLIELTFLKNQTHTNVSNYLEVPGLAAKRLYEKEISGHATLTESLNLSSVLDRKAMALDYWPTFRAICRSERVKSDCKRNNRFSHYLKSTKLSSSAIFDRISRCLEF